MSGASRSTRREALRRDHFPHTVFPDFAAYALSTRVAEALDRALACPIPNAREPSKKKGKKQASLSYAQVMCAVEKGGGFALLKGGIARDIVRLGAKAEVRDIDLALAGVSPDQAVKRINRDCGPRVALYRNKKHGYFAIGDRLQDACLEAMPLCAAPCFADAFCNSMFIDVTSRTLIDPLGRGREDAQKHVWQISCPDADEWLRKTRISLWRMLKFQMKADPMNVPDATAATVYRHWYHDADIADHLWTDLTFRHIAPGRVSEMCDLVVRHVDALRAKRALDFAGRDMLLLLVRKGVLTAWCAGKRT
jgi:hypothetical protein